MKAVLVVSSLWRPKAHVCLTPGAVEVPALSFVVVDAVEKAEPSLA